MWDGGVDVDAVSFGEEEQVIAILELEFALEHQQKPLAVVVVGIAPVAVAGNMEDQRIHRAVSPLVGEVLDDDALLAVLRRRVDATRAVLDDDVLRRNREPLDERIDATLEDVGKLDEAFERRRELAVLQFGKPAHREISPGDDLLERETTGHSRGADAATKIGKVDGCRHGRSSELINVRASRGRLREP